MALTTFYQQLAATQRHIHWYVDRFGAIRGKYRALRHPWKRLTIAELCPLQGTGRTDLAKHDPERTFLRLQAMNIRRIDAEAIIWATDARRGHDPLIRRDLLQSTGIEASVLIPEEGITV